MTPEEIQQKEEALKEFKKIAETEVKANMASLLSTELKSETAKIILKELAEKALSELELKNFEGEGKHALLVDLLKEMDKQHAALSAKFESFKNSEEGKEKIKTILDFVKEKKEALKKAWKSGSEEDEVHMKALTNRASVDGNQMAYEIPEIGQLATRRITLYDLFPKFPVGVNQNGVVRYYDWDEATIVRAATTVAEGQKFPESTAKWKTYVLELKKIGDSIPMTEEFLYDDEMFAAELSAFLDINVQLVVEDQILNGDNIGNNLKGMIASMDEYTPEASDITDASIYDLVPKVSESITVPGGSKYSPNFVLMNKSTINKYKLKKDLDNNYIMPPFVTNNGQVIDGLVVIEANIMANNTMIVGDNRYARIYEQPGVFIGRGQVGDDFLEDKQRLKARRRLLFLIRNADKGGFRYVSDIDAALAVLEQPATT